MTEHSWKPNCPVPLEHLAYIKLKHWGFDKKVHDGELVVHKNSAEQVVDIFKDLFSAKFPIEKMKLIDTYKGSDSASMADNNTSAFNCRAITGKKGVFSKHAYGRAIDINPLRNPYKKGNVVQPKEGLPFLDRTLHRQGIIRQGGPCHQAFTKRGWAWGGAWKSLKDYQHFELNHARIKSEKN